MNDEKSCVFTTGNIIDGKWVIIELIATGGMGEVYRAQQLNLYRDVAIKVISKELLEGVVDNPHEASGALSRFHREMQVMAQVRHPNVLSIFDYGLVTHTSTGDEKCLNMEYIVMEFVPGNTLRFTMSEEGFDGEEGLLINWLNRYFLPVLDGVEAIHAAGIIHRDLKPENVLLDGETPKIGDFGLARSVKLRTVSDSWDVKGTWAYMAPEQFENFRKCGTETDIYTLGKILYEAIDGKIGPKIVPFKSVSLEQPETSLLTAMDKIIRKSTAENREERYQTVMELKQALMEAMTMVRKDFKTSAPSPVAVRWVWAGVAAALLSVLGMTAYHLWFENSTMKTVRQLPSATSPSGMLEETWYASDGQVMTLVREGDHLFYIDNAVVSYHSYHEFLNAVMTKVNVENGVVKSGDEIWFYLGDGSAPHEQISFVDGRFMLRDAAWASHPVVRVTFLGARAYAEFHHKRLPTLEEWTAGVQLLTERYALPAPKTPFGEEPLKEWLADATDPENQEPPIIATHFLPKAEPPAKFYPWEGFNDVGFRTVAVPSGRG